jgi:hypothetical protein
MSERREFTLLENRLRQPFLEMTQKYGRQKYTIWTVWTYMLWRSVDGVFCVPEELVLADLGMSKNTLPKIRDILIREGWLRKDILRDTGGTWLTRVWVITSPLPIQWDVVDNINDTKSFVSPHPIQTEVGSMGNSVSCYGSGFASASVSHSASASFTPSDSNSNKPPPSSLVKASGESKEGGKAKPEPKPKAAKLNGHAPDGAEYPPEFDSWTNRARLEWLGQHGWDAADHKATDVEAKSRFGESWDDTLEISEHLDNPDEL